MSDLESIMNVYRSCVIGMIKIGVDQWDKSYPNAEIISSDLKASTYYIAENEGDVIGGLNIDTIQDNSYLNVNWEDISNSFLVVHRLAIKEEFWNQKIGKELMIFVESLILKKKLKSIRLDTYSGNPNAMIFYKKIGYKERGTVKLKPNKNKYYCFEKIIR
jgi:ribosomal protein S18 acetylase RimI-like enzyme